MGALLLVGFVLLRPAPEAVFTGERASLVVVDGTTVVTVAPPRTAAMGVLVAARDKVKVSLGLVERLFITATPNAPEPAPYPVAELLALLGPEIPTELLRTLEPSYLLGVHSFDHNQPFLILKIDSYDVAYRGMLGWERTMAADLSPLFERQVSPTIVKDLPPVLPTASTSVQTATTTATSTPQAPAAAIIATEFVDRVVENHDARVLLNNDKKILLLWTFLDRRTIAITTNEATLREVISRVAQTPIQYQP